MKKFLLLAFVSLAIAACSMDSYSQYSMTSTSDFEYGDEFASFTDSLYLSAPFWGGSYSYSLVFNSMRLETGENMTGGIGATMKRDSSIVLKPENLYPQYTMFATSAARGSTACAVYYQNDDPELMPSHDIIFSDTNYGSCIPSYFMINNTQQTAYDVLSEDSPSKYEPGDYLKLTITGSIANEYTGVLEETGSVVYYLADWRGEHDVPDSLLTSWKTVSLSKLGDIDYIDFTLESNKEGLVKTFCFDNLVASIEIAY